MATAGRNDADQPRIERHGNDVVAPEARPRALIGGGHFVGHVLARQLGQSMGGGDLHFHVDGRRAHVERAAKNIGKAEDVVDLVRIVRTPGGDDHVVAHRVRLFGRDLRVGIGHGEDDRLRRHRSHHLRRQRALDGEAEDDVGAFQRLGERALVGRRRMRGFPLVHAFGAAAVDDALGVAEDHVLGREADRLDEIETGDAGGTGAVADELRLLDVAAGQVQRVDEAGAGDDGGAVLVVVKHRNVHQLAQALLDDEAFGRANILEIDAAEGRPEIADRVDDLLRIFGGDLDVDRIDVGETLEQDRLAFHDRLGGERPEIAEAEDRGAVGDDGDEIALDRVIIGLGGVGRDRLDRHGDARRIGQRQVALRRHRLRRHDFELAGSPLGVELQRLLVGDGLAFGARRCLVGHDGDELCG